MYLGSLESTQEAREHFALTLLSCSPNFPRASLDIRTLLKHEPILNCRMWIVLDGAIRTFYTTCIIILAGSRKIDRKYVVI